MDVVSLAPSTTDIINELGRVDTLVATTGYDSIDARSIGGYTDIDIDAVRDIDPDLIISSTFLQKQAPEILSDFNVLHVDPKDLCGVYHSIQDIGEALNATTEAEDLIDEMQEDLAAITQSAPNPTPTVYCEEWGDPPYAAGNWVPELVAMAGGQYPYVEPGEPSKEITPHSLEQQPADITILHWCGYGDHQQRSQVRQRNDGWTDNMGRIVTVNDDLLNRPSPSLVKGCQAIQEALCEAN